MEAGGQLVAKFSRFLVVGGIATLIQYAILIALVQTGIADAVRASTIGFAVSAICNYLLNRVWTFRSKSPHVQAASRFGIMVAVGLLLNYAVMRLFFRVVGLDYRVAQVIATAVVLVCNFALSSTWVFRRDPGQGTDTGV
jgi:putative flippase GtrA